MTVGFSLGRVLVRLVGGGDDYSERINDIKLFDSTIKHTGRWYAVAGSIAIAAAPLLYTSLRVLAVKRKASIVRTTYSLSSLSTDLKVMNEKSISLSFYPTSKAVLAMQHILDAQRATDADFSEVFAAEVTQVYVDVVLYGLLRSCCRHCVFHVSVFLVCTLLGSFDGFLVGDASTGRNNVTTAATVATDTAVCCSLLKLLKQMWSQLRHGGLLESDVKMVSSPYAFFNFSVSSPRMLERCFPWLGAVHFAVSRYVNPLVYLDAQWRSPEAVDRVWSVMTPKGFSVMWCCRCLTDLFPPIYYKTSDRTAEYSSEGCGNAHTSCNVIYCGKSNGINMENQKKNKKRFIKSSLYPLIACMLRIGKGSLVLFTLTSCASRTNFSWLPFPCTGGSQYVALCYAEMILAFLWFINVYAPPRSGPPAAAMP